jgi:hypothetical protein
MSDVYGEDGDMNDKRKKRDKLKTIIGVYMIYQFKRDSNFAVDEVFSADEVKAIFAEAVAEAREAVETVWTAPRFDRISSSTPRRWRGGR